MANPILLAVVTFMSYALITAVGPVGTLLCVSILALWMVLQGPLSDGRAR